MNSRKLLKVSADSDLLNDTISNDFVIVNYNHSDEDKEKLKNNSYLNHGKMINQWSISPTFYARLLRQYSCAKKI
jgi:hypothetical protein